jgi:hypothetical protein
MDVIMDQSISRRVVSDEVMEQARAPTLDARDAEALVALIVQDASAAPHLSHHIRRALVDTAACVNTHRRHNVVAESETGQLIERMMRAGEASHD